MITINEMLAIIATEDNTYIKVVPADWVNGFTKRHPINAEILMEKFPEKYRNDLIGFEYNDGAYYPKFATMQDEWNNELKDYCKRKQEWCDKYGCD